MSNTPIVTKITFGVFKFLFGVIVNTFGETISIYNIGCQSPVPVASIFTTFAQTLLITHAYDARRT